ncbi:unnamed protein product [Prunus armeniaca]|uniref:Uncharacterized protein n=1 Tax=Prunus armeniaca TaxID=36596 RepID=A0A6J5W1D2_PRUAR|nr:unnamed protein product [Prunus armeniaca]
MQCICINRGIYLVSGGLQLPAGKLYPSSLGKTIQGSLYDSVADAGKTSMAGHRGSKKSGNQEQDQQRKLGSHILITTTTMLALLSY